MNLFLKCAVFFIQLILISSQKKSSQAPNIIIIVADDVGWNDFSLHGSNQIPTPNIDALGYNGVILDKFYTEHICTPSRAALLTGKYPMRLGLQGTPLKAGDNRSIPLDTTIMPQYLKSLGYATHLVGKWHLGYACKEHTPTKRGFDTHFGYWNGYTGYFSYTFSVPDPTNRTLNMTGFDLFDGFEPQWALKGQYATELFTRKSLEIIETHNTSTPLFLMLTHLAGHTGENNTELGVPNITRTNEVYSYIAGNKRRSYADLVNIMDQSVGDVVAKLSDKGMLDNSIIVFFSDNGAPSPTNYGSNWPFRGLKSTLFEGGVKGTGIVYSPLLLKKNYINKQLIHISDFLPTLYRAAGGDINDLGKIDGVDQWDVISKNSSTKRTDMLLNIDEIRGFSGIFGEDGRYKLLNGTSPKGNGFYGEDGRGLENPHYSISGVINSSVNVAVQTLSSATTLTSTLITYLRGNITMKDCRNNITSGMKCNSLCLFDILNDPCELNNLAEDEVYSDIVDDLKSKLDVYISEIVIQGNEFQDPNCNPKFFNGTWGSWLNCSNSSLSEDALSFRQRWMPQWLS